jgi:hypothetical protein
VQWLQYRLFSWGLRALGPSLLIAMALLSFVGSAVAQSSGQQMEAIQRRMEEGLSLFVADKSLEAAKVFEDGYAEHPYSAFLFNAGVCYEKVGRNEDALAKYKEYMRVDPNSPDIADIRARVAKLEGGMSPDGVVPPGDVGKDVMRALVVVESDPTGAPVRVFRPSRDDAPAFKRGTANPEWQEIVTTTAPTSLSLRVGRYQVVIDKFKDFNASDTELHVSAGHVHHFRANLSQGVFMAFLRVSSNVKGAHLYLDDPKKAKPEWGTTPYGELVPAGEHDLLVEVPGFQPVRTKVTLESGQRKEVEVSMVRVDYGFVRVDADVDEVMVSLDGKAQGRWRKGEPALDVQAAAGSHTLTVTAEDRKDFEQQITIPKGQVLPVRVTMIPKYPRGTAWTQAILAGACVGAGIYLGLESERLKDDINVDRQRGVLQADDERIDKGRWFAIGADVGFGAGAVLGALSTWNFIKDPLPESSHQAAPLVEFDDPLKGPVRATAPTKPGTLSKAPARRGYARETRVSSFDRLKLRVQPTAAPDLAGLVIGGSF